MTLVLEKALRVDEVEDCVVRLRKALASSRDHRFEERVKRIQNMGVRAGFLRECARRLALERVARRGSTPEYIICVCERAEDSYTQGSHPPILNYTYAPIGMEEGVGGIVMYCDREQACPACEDMLVLNSSIGIS